MRQLYRRRRGRSKGHRQRPMHKRRGLPPLARNLSLRGVAQPAALVSFIGVEPEGEHAT